MTDEIARGAVPEWMEKMRQRAERAERERDDLKRRFEVTLDERSRLHTDIQRVEKELDEARNDAAAAFVAGRAENAEALERAEADNAALLEALDEAVQQVESVDLQGAEALRGVLDAEHPGAALLERMRETEQISEDRRQLLEDVARACRGLGPTTPGVEAVVGRALERLRALEAFRKAAGVVEEMWRHLRRNGGVEASISAVLDALDATEPKP